MPEVNRAIDPEIQNIISEAKHAGMSGFEEPSIFGDRAANAARSLKQTYQAKIGSISEEIACAQAEQISKSLYLKTIEKELLGNWHQSPRLIRNLSEAVSAVDSYKEIDGRGPDIWQALSYLLFFFEFFFGYWIFKTVVLPDPGIGNQITSVLVGAMTLAIGVFIKLLPDSTVSVEKYKQYKKWIATVAAISSLVFILLLAFSRRSIDSIDLSHLLLKGAARLPSHSGDSFFEFVFQVSLLATLTFCAAFFAHWKQARPRALMKLLSDQGKELVSWYNGEEFKFSSTENQVRNLDSYVSELRSQRQNCQTKVEFYSDQRILSLKEDAVIDFYRGAITPPLTDSKIRAANNARFLLDSKRQGERKCFEITLASHV